MDASGPLLFQTYAGVDGLLVRVRAGTETLQTPVLWDHVALWVWKSETCGVWQDQAQDKLEKWAHGNLLVFNRAKCKVLHLSQGNPQYQ